MKNKLSNTWRQPPVPADGVPADVVVETIGDIAAVISAVDGDALPRLWSPPGAAEIHGVLWFVSLQHQASQQFATQDPVIILDCAARGDLAHAALREGLRAICFRGTPGMLAKIRLLAMAAGARMETRHPALAD